MTVKTDLVLEYDDAIDQLYMRHDGGQDTRKGVTCLADFTDCDAIPCQEDAALLVALDIYRGVYLEKDTFCFGAERLLARSAFSRMLERACGVPAKKLKGLPREEAPLTVGQAVEQVRALMGDVAFFYGDKTAADTLLCRREAVQMVAQALRASDSSGRLPHLFFVEADTSLQELQLPENTVVCGPDNKLVTLTVDGVFQPLVGGYHYEGDLQLTLTDRYELYRYFTEPIGPGMPIPDPMPPKEPAYWNYFEEPYRAALFIENGEKVPERSVDAAYRVAADGSAYIESSDAPSNAFGANHFNGVIVGGKGGKYEIRDLTIRFNGNGMDDFQGMGAGILVCGDDTKTVIENTDICNYGTVRSTMVVGGSAKVLVKHCRFAAHEGFFEEGWVGGFGAEKMRTAPIWGGFEGNCRSTNLLDKAEANYYDSVITAEKWGVLSTDNNKGCHSTAINSLIAITGGLNAQIDISSEQAARESLLRLPFSQVYGPVQRDLGDHPYASKQHCGGYGTYSIGNTTVKFAGSTVLAADYGNTCVNENARVIYCASTPENLQGVFGADTLGPVPVQNTILYADKVGVMMQRGQGDGGVYIREGTVFHCGVHCFSVKSNGSFHIEADSSTLISESGTILQLMDDDDKPQPLPDPDLPTAEQYAVAQALMDEGLWDVTKAEPGRDVFVRFSNMQLCGDCYNSSGYTGAITRQELEEVQAGTPVPGGPFGPGRACDSARHLSIELEHVTYSGAISAGYGQHLDRDTLHHLSPVPSEKWYCISTLDSRPAPVYQAGVILSLRGSTWNVTKTCYLSSLTVDAASAVRGRVFVNGAPTALVPGVTYTGRIVVEPT